MRYEKRVNKDGTHYYSFVTSERKRLTKEQIRNRFGKDILTEEEAIECLKQLEAKYEAEKLRIQNRLTWEKEFYNFKGLLDQYMEVQKKRAPRSWQNNEAYLRHYVLYYFLQVKKLNNIESWSDHYEAFREWLETKARLIKGKKPLSYASMNHSIKSLNTFMEHLYARKIVSAFHRCEAFPEHMLKQRDIDDLVPPNEMEKIYKRLIKNGHALEAVYFRYLYVTGMRFNEGLCISLGDIYQGDIESEILRKKLHSYSYSHFGYIVSDGQYGGKTANQEVIRLPFKGQKKIEEKRNRILPIGDKELWNQLVDIAERRWSEKPDHQKARDTLIFEGIDDATATRYLQEAFADEKLRWRSWHCLRHSRATWLIGETGGDTMLARLWLGHTSPRTIEKYNHIYQAITRAAKAQSLTGGKTFGLKKA